MGPQERDGMASRGRNGIRGKWWECGGGIGAQGRHWNLGKGWGHREGMGSQERDRIVEKGWETEGMVSWGRDGIERKEGSCRKDRFMGKE